MANMKQAKSPRLDMGDSASKRQEIKNYFIQTYETDEQVYSQLISPEAFYHRGDPLRHIILFYYGHTASFYINKLFISKLIDKRIDPNLESIFAIGVDEMSWDDLNNEHYDWPDFNTVKDYRKKVKELVLNLIDTLPLDMPITQESPMWIILMGIEHERIHIETSSVLLRQLPLELMKPNSFGSICSISGKVPQNEMIEVKGGKILLGKGNDNSYYGWDNEYGHLEEIVEDFKASKYLISNQEFLEFIADAGYQNQKYWTEEGWNWKIYKDATMPLFWRYQDGKYSLRLVTEEIDMPWDWPVEVNYLEAKAYCNWKSAKDNKKYRLPSEAEWQQIYRNTATDKLIEKDNIPANINMEHFSSSCPVNMFKMGDFYDIIGNVWQWTESPITGFPGFKVHPIYDDFSTPTFDGKHNLLMGGSWTSSGNELRPSARYAFRRHFYQYAGIRLIESESEPKIQIADYEYDKDVIKACDRNWASKENFDRQLAKICFELCGKDENLKVIDLNADTGRLAFELATIYQNVTALDFTARMIKVAIQLREQGYMRYVSKDEGDIQHFNEVVLDEYGLGKNKDKISFMQIDPMNIKPIYKDYDIAIFSNGLKELSNPKLFLSKIHERLNPKAFLIIASDYEWDENFTTKDNWLGGYKKDGESMLSLDGIKECLDGKFDLIKIQEANQEIHISSRIKQTHQMQISIWRLK